jgi:hypothetical protein
VDPPPKRRGPRTVAAVRGPKSHISIIIFITPCDTRKPSSFAHATVCACSCATASDDFATASAAGNLVFLIRLKPGLGRDGRPSLRLISGASAPNHDGAVAHLRTRNIAGAFTHLCVARNRLAWLDDFVCEVTL